MSFNFCPKCGGVSHWVSRIADGEGRIRIAVNLRLSEPEPIAAVRIDHFDGLKNWEDLPTDGRCVNDMWF